MFCSNCGSKVNDGDVFCVKCGAKLDKEVEKEPVVDIKSDETEIQRTESQVEDSEDVIKALNDTAWKCPIIKKIIPLSKGVALRGKVRRYNIGIVSDQVRVVSILDGFYSILHMIPGFIISYLAASIAWDAAYEEYYSLLLAFVLLWTGGLLAVYPFIGRREKEAVLAYVREVAESKGVALESDHKKTKGSIRLVCCVIALFAGIAFMVSYIVGNVDFGNGENEDSTTWDYGTADDMESISLNNIGMDDTKNITISQIYSNDEEGFYFMYPDGWIVDEEYPDALVMISVPSESVFTGSVASIAVMKDYADDAFFSATVSDFEEEWAEMMGDGIKSIHDVGLEDIILSGHSARKLSYTVVADNGVSSKQIVYFYMIDYEMFAICCTSSEDSWDKYEFVFEEIMDGYTITKQSEALSQDGGDAGSLEAERAEGVYYMGETASVTYTYPSGNAGDCDITMTDYGTYVPEYTNNDIYVYVTFDVVNTGDENISINEYDFNAYVYDYKADIGYLFADNGLSATLSPGRRTSGSVYIKMNPEDVNNLELELGDIIFRIQDNGFTEEIPFGYEGEENYTDYIEWGGNYDGGWLDTTLTLSLYSDGTQNPECGYIRTYFRGMESSGKLYYLGGNEFRWEDEGYSSNSGETYYVCAIYNNGEYQLDLYNGDGAYEVTFTLYEQYIP